MDGWIFFFRCLSLEYLCENLYFSPTKKTNPLFDQHPHFSFLFSFQQNFSFELDVFFQKFSLLLPLLHCWKIAATTFWKKVIFILHRRRFRQKKRWWIFIIYFLIVNLCNFQSSLSSSTTKTTTLKQSFIVIVTLNFCFFAVSLVNFQLLWENNFHFSNQKQKKIIIIRNKIQPLTSWTLKF